MFNYCTYFYLVVDTDTSFIPTLNVNDIDFQNQNIEEMNGKYR
jgi:hypothetical protein